MINDKDQVEDPRPPSRRIADELRHAIARGDFAPGEKLPSERELASHYGTARNTAREAIRLLSEDGLILVEHGRGVFVRPIAPLLQLGNDRYASKYRHSGLSPFLLECAKQGKSGRFEVLSIDRIVPSREVAERLEVSAQERSDLQRENVFYADADPVHRVITYVPWTIAEGTGLLEPEVGHPYGIHGIFEDHGHVMTRIREEILARMPGPEERQSLQLPPSVPVLDVLHTSLNQHGKLSELTRFVMGADMTGLLHDIPVE
jgi:GntR family transcriptional regulator